MAYHAPDFLKSMFNNRTYSDVTVSIQGLTLYAHRVVICSQSQYFEKAFQNSFLEGEKKDITFNEGSVAAHYRVFEFLYTGAYSEDLLSEQFEDDPVMLRDVRVYGLAEMLLLEDLKKLSLDRLDGNLKGFLQESTLPACIREVYALTSDVDDMRS